MAKAICAPSWRAQTWGALAALMLSASPLMAKTNSYGGYDIAGDNGVAESHYGDARGWTISKGSDGRTFAYCMAQYGAEDDAWRIGWDGMQWQIAVPYGAAAEWDGALEIDGTRYAIAGTGDKDNAIAWLGMQDVVNLAKGNRMILDVGKASIDKPLTGSAAAILKVEECVADNIGTPEAYIGVAEFLMPAATDTDNGEVYADDAGEAAGRPCPDDGPRLPGSGVCATRAINYLNDPVDDLPIEPGRENCTWVVNEAALPNGWLLYKALKCGDKTATLEFAGGANRGELTLIDGPYGADDAPIAYLYAKEGTAEDAIMAAARDATPGKGALKGCRVVPDMAVATHYQIDNVTPEQAMKLLETSDGPRAACGPMGLNEDEPRFWQDMGDEVWFVQQSQDAYQSVEVMSWAIITTE